MIAILKINRKPLTLQLAVLGLTLSIGMLDSSKVHAAAIPVIFDTDMSGDCDDAGALALLHKYADDGEATILAIGAEANADKPGNKLDISTPGAIDAVNHYYGRPDIPIGRDTTREMEITGRFTQTLALDFPNTIRNNGTSVPSGVKVYRQALASQADGSVVFIAVGGAPLLKQLLESPADGYSPLAGKELVAAKVSKLSLMMTWRNGRDEYNTKIDPVAAKYVFDNWPTPIIITDANLGAGTFTGSGLTANTPVTNPVRKAYELYVGPGKNNASWDLMATLYAIKGGESWFELDPERQNGHVIINTGDGTSTWNATSRTNTTYLRWKTGTTDPWLGVAAEMNAGIHTAPKLLPTRLSPSIQSGLPVNNRVAITVYNPMGVVSFRGMIAGSGIGTMESVARHLPSVVPGVYLVRMSDGSKQSVQSIRIK